MPSPLPPRLRTLLFLLLAAFLLAGLLLTLLHAGDTGEPPADPGPSPDARAALEAVAAFYTLDHRDPPGAWASRLCLLATEAGCRMAREFYAPAVSALVENEQIATGCTVTLVRLLAESGDRRIWLVSARVETPWAALQDPEQEVGVEVLNRHGEWKFNRLLFTEEVQRYARAGSGGSQ